LRIQGVKDAYDCSDGALNCVADLCGGSAYIIREVARSMARSEPSVLSISNKTVTLVKTFRAVRDVPLSSRVNKMIGAEIDNVELQGQILLKMLAVVMKPCKKDLLYASYPLVHHRDYVADALNDLMERNLVTNTRAGVFFTSPFVFHVVRQRLVEMLRVEIRTRINLGQDLVSRGEKMPEGMFLSFFSIFFIQELTFTHTHIYIYIYRFSERPPPKRMGI